MLDIICLWIGRIVFSILLIALIGIFIYCFSFLRIPLRRPWYCIKRLMPWKWISKEDYKLYKRICQRARKNPDKFEKRKTTARVVRKGRFGNLIIPDNEHWWAPKNHFFIIKKG